MHRHHWKWVIVAGVWCMAFAWAENQRFTETTVFAFPTGAAAVTAGLLFLRD